MKMIIIPLPNDSIPKPKKRRFITAAIKNLSTKISMESKVNSYSSQ